MTESKEAKAIRVALDKYERCARLAEEDARSVTDPLDAHVYDMERGTWCDAASILRRALRDAEAEGVRRSSV